MPSSPGVTLAEATDLKILHYLRAKKKIDDDLEAAARELLNRRWGPDILDWIVVNYVSEPNTNGINEHLARAIAEVAMRTVLSFSFDINHQERLSHLKTELYSKQSQAENLVKTTIKLITDKNRWTPDITIVSSPNDPFQEPKLTNLVEPLCRWLKTDDDWLLRQEHLDKILQATPKYRGIPLVPAREGNDDMVAHRQMARLETTLHWFIHAMNTDDDAEFEKASLVTLQLLCDSWAQLNRQHINRILQIKGDTKRLNESETRYDDDHHFKVAKMARQRQIQQNQQGRGSRGRGSDQNFRGRGRGANNNNNNNYNQNNN